MTMIEKIANIIDDKAWPFSSKEKARMILRIMHEPTKEMIEAANNSNSLEEGSSAYGCWCAMIKAALKE